MSRQELLRLAPLPVLLLTQVPPCQPERLQKPLLLQPFPPLASPLKLVQAALPCFSVSLPPLHSHLESCPLLLPCLSSIQFLRWIPSPD